MGAAAGASGGHDARQSGELGAARPALAAREPLGNRAQLDDARRAVARRGHGARVGAAAEAARRRKQRGIRGAHAQQHELPCRGAAATQAHGRHELARVALARDRARRGFRPRNERAPECPAHGRGAARRPSEATATEPRHLCAPFFLLYPFRKPTHRRLRAQTLSSRGKTSRTAAPNTWRPRAAGSGRTSTDLPSSCRPC